MQQLPGGFECERSLSLWKGMNRESNRNNSSRPALQAQMLLGYLVWAACLRCTLRCFFISSETCRGGYSIAERLAFAAHHTGWGGRYCRCTHPPPANAGTCGDFSLAEGCFHGCGELAPGAVPIFWIPTATTQALIQEPTRHFKRLLPVYRDWFRPVWRVPEFEFMQQGFVSYLLFRKLPIPIHMAEQFAEVAWFVERTNLCSEASTAKALGLNMVESAPIPPR